MAGEHKLQLELTDEAKGFLIDKGYNPDFGARPLRRAIEQHVEDYISEEILRGVYKDKAKIAVSLKTEKSADGEEEKHLYFEGVGKAGEKAQPVEEVHEAT